MLVDQLKNYAVVLASQSPRRKELLGSLGIPFSTFIFPNIDESFPESLDKLLVAEFLSNKKADAYTEILKENTLLITADTIVCNHDTVFGKPETEADALQILEALSGKTHQVVTGVTLSGKHKRTSFSAVTDVTFSNLTQGEIMYYIKNFQPFDKAGAYGIQEWIGHIGVKSINGSYFNVMGLPVQKLYTELKKF